MQKTYKPLTKFQIFIISISVILGLPLGLYGILRTSVAQTYLTHKIAGYLSKNLRTTIKVGKVDISFLDILILEDVYVEDLQKDTLLYVKKLRTTIGDLNFSQNKFQLHRVELKNLVFNLKEDAKGNLNLQFIIDKFSSNDTTQTPPSEPLHIKCRDFKLIDAQLSYHSYKPDTVEFGMNFDDLKIKKLTLISKNVSVINDSIALAIDSLHLEEQCGFVLNNFSANAIVSSTIADLKNLRFSTPKQTNVSTDYFVFRYNSWGEYPDFITKVNMHANLRDSSTLCFTDISYFASVFKGFDQIVNVKGAVDGTVANLRADSFKINYRTQTELFTNFRIEGLPDINKTHFDIAIHNLSTNREDFASIKDPSNPTKQFIDLPKQLNQLGRISYNGRIEGTFVDFSANGGLFSNLGMIATKVNIVQDTIISKTAIKGNLIAENLEIGKLIGDEKNFGKLTFHQDVNLNILKDSLIGNAKGKIDSVFVNHYKYNNIEIDGDFSNKMFAGAVKINDPNLQTWFKGTIDFEKAKPVFDFEFAVEKAKLYKLKLIKDNPLTNLSFALRANFSGISPDDINGEIRLSKKLIYIADKKDFALNNFSVSSKIESYFAGKPKKKIIIRSDYFDASVNGSISFESLPDAINSFISTYLPSLNSTPVTNEPLAKSAVKVKPLPNNFQFVVNLNKTKKISDVFLPSVQIEDSTKLVGKFNSINNELVLRCNSKLIETAGVKFADLLVNASSEHGNFNFGVNCSKLAFTNASWIENFALTTQSKNDTTALHLFWDNKRSKSQYFGDIRSKLLFGKNDSNKLILKLYTDESTIKISDTVWTIPRSSILNDSTSIQINNLQFINKTQSIAINGTVSEEPNDTLSLKFERFNLNTLNTFTGDLLNVQGILNGTTKLKRLYDRPLFYTNDSISSLVINKVSVGNMFIKSRYMLDESVIHLNIFTLVGQKKTKDISIEGIYYPTNHIINFNVGLQRFKLKLLKPYYNDYVDLHPSSELLGKISIAGTIEKPKINANLKVTGATVFVKYLQTQYDQADSIGINIDNNNIQIHRTKLYSDKGSGYGFVSGNIKHTDFDKFNLNLLIDAHNFMVLNTTESDTSYFYGAAYMTGEVNIKGRPEKISIDVAAKTEKKTKFYIPLSSTSEVSDNTKFINFISKDVTHDKVKNDYKVDLSGLNLNLDLEVTPDAEIQLIMDKKIGDIIKARGSANLKIEITSAGAFNMFGDYNIAKGDYLFTLKNLISKKFDIASGGTIKWNGNPMDAAIDLSAIYNIKKVPLYDLVIEDEYRETKIPVECHLKMGDKLMSPSIKFGLKLPNADEKIVTQINNLDEDNVNKEVLSLLVLNRFRPLPGLNPVSQNASSAVINTGELLSNQINNLLAQVSNDINIGVNYQTGDESNKTALEVALSKNFFDDRVVVNGNFGVGGGSVDPKKEATGKNTNSTNNIIGDFNMEVKMNKKGNVRLKVFNKTNNDLNYSEYPYTQGVGIFLRKDFDSFFKKKKKK